MARKVIIIDDGYERRPQPGARAAGRLIALTLTIATLGAVLAVLGKVPSLSLDNSGDAQKQKARSPVAQELLAEARKFDSLGYKWGGGHNPKQWVANNKAGSKDGVDCSGLVDVAVYIVTKGKINSSQVAEGFQNDKNWDNLSISKAQLGDIVWRNPGHRGPIAHVGILIENDPEAREVTIFEAKSSKLPYKDQVRVSTYPYADFQGASRLNFKG